MSTNFITPNEFKQQQEKIARRKRMAELIRSSAATPIESPGVAGAKTSPWQVLIKALQGGIGGYEENRANKEEAALIARQDASEQNANEQFAAEQNPYGRQRQLPERPPDYITPTETFAVPDSLTPHQAPEMLPGTDQAQYLASIAPTVTSQIPEQVPGREMPPPPPNPPTYIQSLVAALGQNKKGNEYVDQRRLALANVLNSKDPNKIKFMLDQMGSREEFEQQRQLEFAKAGYGLTSAELKFNRDVQMAKDKGDLDELARLRDNKDKILAAEKEVEARGNAALRLAEVEAKAARSRAEVEAEAALRLAEVQKNAKEVESQVKADAAKAKADAATGKVDANRIKSLGNSQTDNFRKAPVSVQTSALNNQLIMDDIEEAIVFLEDIDDDSMELSKLPQKSFFPRLSSEKAIRDYAKLGSITAHQIRDLTGKQSNEAEIAQYKNFTINVNGAGGLTADTKRSALVKLNQYFQEKQRQKKLIANTYKAETISSRPPEVPPAILWNYSQKDKDDYVVKGKDVYSPPPEGVSLEQWDIFTDEEKSGFLKIRANRKNKP